MKLARNGHSGSIYHQDAASEGLAKCGLAARFWDLIAARSGPFSGGETLGTTVAGVAAQMTVLTLSPRQLMTTTSIPRRGRFFSRTRPLSPPMERSSCSSATRPTWSVPSSTRTSQQRIRPRHDDRRNVARQRDARRPAWQRGLV